MRRRSFLLQAGAVAAAVATGFWLKDHVLNRKVAIEFVDGGSWMTLLSSGLPLPVVEARLGDVRVRALIDTGAQYSVIDARLAQELEALGVTGQSFSMPMLAYGVGGQTQVGRGIVLPLSMAGIRVAALRAAILDLGPLAQEQGLDVGLIIGRDLLAGAVLEIDTKQDRARLVDPRHWRPEANMIGTPANLVGGAMLAELVIEGKVVQAVIDTGASSLVSLSGKTAQRVGILDGREQTEGQSLVLGGVSKAQWVKVDSVRFADEAWRNVRVPVYADSPLPNYPDALLGMGAFKGRKLAIDMGLGRLYVSGQLDLTIR